MPRYEFTDQAESDLDTIIDFTLERWCHVQAEKYLAGLEEFAQKRMDPKRQSYPFMKHNNPYAQP